MPLRNCTRFCSKCQDSCYSTYFEKPDLIRVNDRSQLKEGTHLQFWRGHLGHSHHALYVNDAEGGDDMIHVIHGSSGGARCECDVHEDDLPLHQPRSRTFMVDYSNIYGKIDGRQVIKEMREEHGNQWKAFTFNCEHAARLVYQRQAYERDQGFIEESEERRVHMAESHQCQCLGFACLQALFLFFIRAFWRIALYVFIQFGFKNLEQTDDETTCSPEKESRQQLFFEVVIGCLLAAVELVFLIIECRCCCGGEFCCGPCHCACRSQRCCCCIGGTLFPIKIRKFIISLFRVSLTIGFAILFESQFGEPCNANQVGWSVLGSFVGAISGTVLGWCIGTWIAFPIEVYCMDAYAPSDLEDVKIKYSAVEMA